MIIYNQLANVAIELRETDETLDLYVQNSNILVATFKVDDSDFKLNIDNINIENDVCNFSGWSMDLDYMLPAKCIIVFQKNRLKKIIKVMEHRADVSMVYSTYVDYLGFNCKFRCNDLEDIKILCVRPSNEAIIVKLNG